MKHSILCVDDEADNVDALERLFRRKYNVLKSTSPVDALELLRKNKVTVIISDQRMPNLTGVELLAESIKMHPNAIRILLTGYTDIDSVVAAINSGHIYRYVTKPWDPVDLLNAVDKAVERYEIGEELIEKNVALERALAELQTLDQAKSQFMILVNHELKTPLTSMLSFADLLAETDLDSIQKRMLSRIKGAAVRLQDMINDALEYVSAETKQMPLDLRAVETRGIFENSSLPETITKLAAERGVRFKYMVENGKIRCDEKVMRNVFRRLMHNAAKFAGSDSDVEVTCRPDISGFYRVSIRNRGGPIDDRQIAKLMKPFTLNENILNHSVGTGLGLSICQAMLKLHGSALEFVSRNSEIVVSFQLPAFSEN